MSNILDGHGRLWLSMGGMFDIDINGAYWLCIFPTVVKDIGYPISPMDMRYRISVGDIGDVGYPISDILHRYGRLNIHGVYLILTIIDGYEGYWISNMLHGCWGISMGHIGIECPRNIGDIGYAGYWISDISLDIGNVGL